MSRRARTGERATPERFDRVRSSAEIREIRRKGSRARGTYVTAWRLFRGETPEATALGVVTTRGYRSAVLRNLARRRVLGCIMDSRDALAGGRYLVEARPEAAEIDYQKLVKDVQDVISRVSRA